MTWHGPQGSCGCCKCDCIGGGSSRRFSNEPTVKVVVSGLPEVYSFDSTSPSSASTRTYSSVTITGLDTANGTYFLPFQKSANCIDYGVSVPPPSPIDFSSVDVSVVARTLSGSSGCYVSATSTYNESPGLRLASVLDRTAPPPYGVSTTIFNQYEHPDTSMRYGAFLYDIIGLSFAECKDDYDPAITTAQITRSLFITSTVVTKNASEQKIYIATYPVLISACATATAYNLIEIGSITTELLDL
jgi:hypothetical protein